MLPISPLHLPTEPLTNAQPFTYRDGLTYLGRLERLKKYVTTTLVNWIQDSYTEVTTGTKTEVDRVINEFNNLVEQIINNSIELQDPVMGVIVSSLESETHAALDTLYSQETLATDVVQNGNVLREALDTLYVKTTDFDALVSNLTASINQSTAELEQSVNTSIATMQNLIDTKINQVNSTVNAALNKVNATPLGRARAAFAARFIRPANIVFLGDSIVAGSSNGPTSNRDAAGGGVRFVDRVLQGIQARYPSGYDYETTVTGITTTPYRRPGVHGYNGGVGGLESVDLLASGRLNNIANIQPALVIINIGLNDWSGKVPVETYKSNVESAIYAIKGVVPTGVSFILVHDWMRGGVTSPVNPWEDYKAALESIAAEDDDVVFVDVMQDFHKAINLNVNDPYDLLSFDNVHATDRGHDLMADRILERLLITATDNVRPMLVNATDWTAYDLPTQSLVGNLWDYPKGDGNWAIADGYAYANTTTMLGTDIGGAYSVITADIKKPSAGYAALQVRFLNNDNFLFGGLANNEIRVGAFIGGATQIYGTFPNNVTDGTIQRVRVENFNNVIQIWIDDVHKGNFTIPTEHMNVLASATRVGIWQTTLGPGITGFNNVAVVARTMNGVGATPGQPSNWHYLALKPGATGTCRWKSSKTGEVTVEFDVTFTSAHFNNQEVTAVETRIGSQRRPGMIVCGSGIARSPFAVAAPFVRTNGEVVFSPIAAGSTRVQGTINYQSV